MTSDEGSPTPRRSGSGGLRAPCRRAEAGIAHPLPSAARSRERRPAPCRSSPVQGSPRPCGWLCRHRRARTGSKAIPRALRRAGGGVQHGDLARSGHSGRIRHFDDVPNQQFVRDQMAVRPAWGAGAYDTACSAGGGVSSGHRAHGVAAAECDAECSLDESEVRRYTSWYRHITLTMLAHAFLAAMATLEREKGVATMTHPTSWTSHQPKSAVSWQLALPRPAAAITL